MSELEPLVDPCAGCEFTTDCENILQVEEMVREDICNMYLVYQACLDERNRIAEWLEEHLTEGNQYWHSLSEPKMFLSLKDWLMLKGESDAKGV